MRSERRSRDADLRNDLLILQHVLAANVPLRRQREKLVERNDTFAFRSRHRDARAKRQQHRREIGWMNDVRRATGDDGVVLVLARRGVTLRAAFLQTVHFFEPEIPATRTLAQVAADRAEVA